MLISKTLSAVHCVWDEWVLGECSAECGVGTRTNTRVKLVEEANGGTCDGQPTEIEECQAGKCPSKLLTFVLQSERQYLYNCHYK